MSVIEAYLAGPKDLRAAVEGLNREHLVSRPVPGSGAPSRSSATSPIRTLTLLTESSVSYRRSDRPSSVSNPI